MEEEEEGAPNENEEQGRQRSGTQQARQGREVSGLGSRLWF